jgi:endonuclease VIII
VAEGDTILRLARRLNPALAGQTIAVRAPGPRRPAGLPVAEIDAHRLERVESRGKHLLFHFDEAVLHSHLGMKGSWQLYERGERWRRPASQAWLALTGDSTEAVNFGGSSMRIATERQLRLDPKLSRLGPDLLAEDFDPAEAIPRLRSRGPELLIGEALLGQRLVAGIGNIFRSEGCFEARIDPNSPVGALADDQLAEVLESTRKLMLDAVETGRQPSRVYRKSGQPCPRCGTAIRSRAQGDSARVSYWCPGCQRSG